MDEEKFSQVSHRKIKIDLKLKKGTVSGRINLVVRHVSNYADVLPLAYHVVLLETTSKTYATVSNRTRKFFLNN